jgi:hypothetical protein
MAMSTWMTYATVLAGLNVLLLATLTVVWLRNYRTFRTPLILGLVAFSAVMLVENAVAVYFFLSMGMLYSGDPLAQQFVLGMRALELVAVSFLTYVSLK